MFALSRPLFQIRAVKASKPRTKMFEDGGSSNTKEDGETNVKPRMWMNEDKGVANPKEKFRS